MVTEEGLIKFTEALGKALEELGVPVNDRAGFLIEFVYGQLRRSLDHVKTFGFFQHVMTMTEKNVRLAFKAQEEAKPRIIT